MAYSIYLVVSSLSMSFSMFTIYQLHIYNILLSSILICTGFVPPYLLHNGVESSSPKLSLPVFLILAEGLGG